MSNAARSPAPEEPKIKGVALERFLDWYGTKHGAAQVRALVDGLAPHQKTVLDTSERSYGVLANGWYPASFVHALLDAMTRGMNARERTELAEAAAESIVRSSLRGIYKVLFQLFMTPERYAARAQALWDRYYDSGTITKRILGPRAHDSRIVDWTGHHPVLCEMNAVSARIIYEELGCRNVRVERACCVSRGDDACTQSITWD